VMVLAEFTVTIHILANTEVHPVQLVKVELEAGRAVRVIEVPELYDSVQSAPHAIPTGRDEIIPVPVPVFLAVSVYFGSVVKVAVTILAAFIVTTHVVPSVLVHPVHPVKADHVLGRAMRVASDPLG